MIRGLATGDDPADIGQGALDDEPRPLHAQLERVERPDGLKVGVVRRRRPCDAENANAVHVAEAILGLAERGNGLEGDVDATAVDFERQHLTRAGAHDLLHVGETLDRASIDGQNQIAGLEPGNFRGAAGLDCVYARRRTRLAKHHE